MANTTNNIINAFQFLNDNLNGIAVKNAISDAQKKANQIREQQQIQLEAKQHQDLGIFQSQLIESANNAATEVRAQEADPIKAQKEIQSIALQLQNTLLGITRNPALAATSAQGIDPILGESIGSIQAGLFSKDIETRNRAELFYALDQEAKTQRASAKQSADSGKDVLAVRDKFLSQPLGKALATEIGQISKLESAVAGADPNSSLPDGAKLALINLSKTSLAKAFGEDRVTEEDIARTSVAKSIKRRFGVTWDVLINNRPDALTVKDYQALVGAMKETWEKNARKSVRSRSKVDAKELRVSPKRIEDVIFGSLGTSAEELDRPAQNAPRDIRSRLQFR